MKISSKILTALSSLLLIACVQEPAKIEYHLNDFYGYVEDGNTDKPSQKDFNLKRTNIPNYNVDSYQAPSKISVENIDNNITPKKADDSSELVVVKSKTSAVTNRHKKGQLIKISGTTHIVEKGQTLYAISRKYNIPLLPIILANKLKSPYFLNEGQEIKIPDADFHIVEQGDTLYSLSRKYSVDLRSIVKLNQLNEPYSLFMGQKIQIPFPTVAKSSENKAYDELRKESQIDNSAFISEKGPLPKRPIGLAIEVPPTNKPAEFKDGETKIVSKDYSASRSDNLKDRSDQKKKAIRRQTSTKYKDDGKFIWPVKGKLIGKFGKQPNNEYNDGIYIDAPIGRQVLASLSGRVVYTGDSLKSYGNLVIIKHDNGLLSAYAHLEKINVKKDQQVKKGDVVGTVGQTGKVDNPKLYFAIRKGKEAKDPLKFLR